MKRTCKSANLYGFVHDELMISFDRKELDQYGKQSSIKGTRTRWSGSRAE